MDADNPELDEEDGRCTTHRPCSHWVELQDLLVGTFRRFWHTNVVLR